MPVHLPSSRLSSQIFSFIIFHTNNLVRFLGPKRDARSKSLNLIPQREKEKHREREREVKIHGGRAMNSAGKGSSFNVRGVHSLQLLE